MSLSELVHKSTIKLVIAGESVEAKGLAAIIIAMMLGVGFLLTCSP